MKSKLSWDELQRLALKVYLSGSERCESRSFLVLMVEDFGDRKTFKSARIGDSEMILSALRKLVEQMESSER